MSEKTGSNSEQLSLLIAEGQELLKSDRQWEDDLLLVSSFTERARSATETIAKETVGKGGPSFSVMGTLLELSQLMIEVRSKYHAKKEAALRLN